MTNDDWIIDIEDGARAARFAIDSMIKDNNPLFIAVAMREFLGSNPPPQAIGFLNQVGEALLLFHAGSVFSAGSAGTEAAQPLPQERPVLRLVR